MTTETSLHEKGQSSAREQSVEESRQGRQYLKYTFYKLSPSWRTSSEGKRIRAKEEFRAIVSKYEDTIIVKAFSLIGTRGDADFMLWTISERLEDFQDLLSEISRSVLGQSVSTPYSYLSMTRKSEYIREHRHVGQEGAALKKVPGNAKYLFVYPFVKKREWYNLSLEDRQRMMMDHIRSGHKFPSVKINTSYSFGLDDQEFVLSFETDYPSDFLELVMLLRSTDASKYTQLEVPIFTCIATTPDELVKLF